MHRESILLQLNEYHSRWPTESTATQQLIQFVTSHSACFERSLQVGHVTGSAWVVNQAGTHVLLTHHRKLNKWLQLGGHADGDPEEKERIRDELWYLEEELEYYEDLDYKSKDGPQGLY